MKKHFVQLLEYNKKIVSVLILVILSHQVVATELTIDGSSNETFFQSLAAMEKSLNKQDAQQLLKARLQLGSAISGKNYHSEEAAKLAAISHIRAQLDGKTFKQIIASTKTAVDSQPTPSAEDNIKNIITSEAYQHNADLLRLQHLTFMGKLIEAYKQKKGHYPLQDGSSLEHYVFLANEQQKRHLGSGPPYRHKQTAMEVFERELETVLEKNIELPTDPQVIPVNKPNFYIYMVHQDRYFFAVHLHDGKGFANKLAPHYYKAEISNVNVPEKNVMTYEKLKANFQFQTRIKETLIIDERSSDGGS